MNIDIVNPFPVARLWPNCPKILFYRGRKGKGRRREK
jgi:hypothetical protein